MPITSKENMVRMAELALGARVPGRLLRAIERCGIDPQAVAKVGVHWATEQCRDLLDNQVRGIHFYTLNRSDATRQIYENLGVKDSKGLEYEADFLNHPFPMTTLELTQRLKAEAQRLGFDRVGIAPAVSPPGHDRLLEWLRAGHAAGMTYLEKHAEARAHPDRLLDGVRSVVMVSVVYGKSRSGPSSASAGQDRAVRAGAGLSPRPLGPARAVALLGAQRDAREPAAGQSSTPLPCSSAISPGWPGWDGSARTPCSSTGSWGASPSWAPYCVDCELAADAPHLADHCGTCTRCLDACPTDAFAGPYQLDARRCISYWTIEHRGPIADELAGQLHGWVFGCDVCQEVCPWNRKSPEGQLPEFEAQARWTDPDLIEWLDRDGDVWKSAPQGNVAGAGKTGRPRPQCGPGPRCREDRRGSPSTPSKARRSRRGPHGPHRFRLGAGPDRNGACARRYGMAFTLTTRSCAMPWPRR